MARGSPLKHRGLQFEASLLSQQKRWICSQGWGHVLKNHPGASQSRPHACSKPPAAWGSDVLRSEGASAGRPKGPSWPPGEGCVCLIGPKGTHWENWAALTQRDAECGAGRTAVAPRGRRGRSAQRPPQFLALFVIIGENWGVRWLDLWHWALTDKRAETDWISRFRCALARTASPGRGVCVVWAVGRGVSTLSARCATRPRLSKEVRLGKNPWHVLWSPRKNIQSQCCFSIIFL